MLSDKHSIKYFENLATETERAEIEMLAAKDSDAVPTLIAQQRMDQALHIALGEPGAMKRVRQSILDAVHGEEPATVPQHLPESVQPWTQDSTPPKRVRDSLVPVLALAAAACLAIGLWIAAPRPDKSAGDARINEPSKPVETVEPSATPVPSAGEPVPAESAMPSQPGAEATPKSFSTPPPPDEPPAPGAAPSPTPAEPEVSSEKPA